MLTLLQALPVYYNTSALSCLEFGLQQMMMIANIILHCVTNFRWAVSLSGNKPLSAN